MSIHSVLRRGCRSGQQRCSLLWRFSVTVLVLAILASVATQAVLDEVESNASEHPADTFGNETNSVVAQAPAVHINAFHVLSADDKLTPASAVPQHHDDAALGAPKSSLSQQGHYEQATKRATELHTDSVPADRKAGTSSPLPSEAFTEESVRVARDWPEQPLPQQDVPSQVPLNSTLYSGEEENWQHEQQHQATEPTASAPSLMCTDDTDVPYVGDAHAAPPATEPATVSNNHAGITAAAADAAQGWEASPPPPHEDVTTPAQPDEPSAFDKDTPSTPAWKERDSSASPQPRTEDRLPFQRDGRDPHEDQQSAALDHDARTTPQSGPGWEVTKRQQEAAAEAAHQETPPASTANAAPASPEAPTAQRTSEELHQAWAGEAHEEVGGEVSSDSPSVLEAQEQQLPEHHDEHQQWTEGGGVQGDGATHGAEATTADDGVLTGTSGGLAKEVWPAEAPLPEAELTAEEHAATAEVPETDRSVSLFATADVASDVPVSPEESGEAAAYVQATEDQVEPGDAASATDADTIRDGKGAATQFWEGPDDTAAAETGFTEGAESSVRESAADVGNADGDELNKEREGFAPSSTASAAITTPCSSTDTPYHPWEHHVLHPRSPPPSRLALSYLYYHALEALYVDENVTLFVQRARDVAPYGHARLNWLLGVLHAYGVGVPRSERDALMYYSFAAMEAVPEAHMALGYRYKLGLGVVESCESALAHYREAADAVAMTYDGTAAASDSGVTPMAAGAKTIGSGRGSRSGSTSFFAYRDDAAASDVRKQRRLDLISLKYQADIGDVDAILTLGYLLLKGDYQVARDGRRAATYFKAAAEQGSARAQGALGQLYMAGDSSITPPLRPDLRRALHHFRLGALQNDALSLNGIGFLHAIGYLHQDQRHGAADTNSHATDESDVDDKSAAPPLNGPPDFVTAAQYFYRSHCAEGLYNLGVLFLHGRGVVLDKKQARRLFERAAKQGSVLAQWQLANMLSEVAEDSRGIPAAECERALALYQRTASFGTWQHRAPGNHRSGGGAAVGSDNANVQPQRQRHGDAAKKMGINGDGDAQLLRETRDRHVSSHDGSRGQDDDGGAANHLGGFVRPRSEAEYQVLLAGILDRLHAVEESLVSSDEGEGPTTVSLASFVELLSLTETGDAVSPWVAAQYVDEYLEVADTTLPDGRHVGKAGAVPLLWPSPSTPAGTPQYLSGEAAASELLYHLLQRTVLHHTHTHATLGAAYLRLGNFYYYGESPLYGVNMERALAYYRIAGDQHHNAQALFNVGFMYQLGLHKAPRVTRVVGGMSAQEVAGRPDVLRHYTSVPTGAEWMVHSNPPEYLVASPAFYLAVKAAANAWDRTSADPMARGVDVYLSWKYYTASLRQEERGWMAVQFALLILNVQWSLRHFGISGLLPQSSAFTSPSASSSTSADSTFSLDEVGMNGVDVPLSTGVGGAHWAHQDRLAALQGPLGMLTAMLQVMWSHVKRSAVGAAKAMLSWYELLENAMLYGAIFVAVIGLLVRHHVA
ncbi:hypothetical protein LPMP_070630 [Leishmania panamensis]|uniref:Sel1 repeat family protein n=1 Tax=Leishmania panamensis TaxID=5679 RepID=A0A088RKR9_LEIPA|nr:hypothetical protein LPMP_070630 [Leishmania panamensis]AIN95749.1 hypothetical protein LPMP_070630 [Leishmania panamensis]